MEKVIKNIRKYNKIISVMIDFNQIISLIITDSILQLKDKGCSVQFSHSIISDPLDRSTAGLPVHQQLPELTQAHVPRVSDAIQTSSSVTLFSSCIQSFQSSGSFL